MLKDKKVYIYGKHILEEALKYKPHALRKVFLSLENKKSDLYQKLIKLKIPVAFIKNKDGSKMVGKDSVHQGFIAVLNLDELLLDFSAFIDNLRISKKTALVLLDELTDPQNVGSIIRSAAAFDIQGILLPMHRQSGVTSAVVKVSAGMVFNIPIVEINNVNYTLDFLKEKGFKVVALDMNGDKILNKVQLEGPLIFVLGNEGFGIREKTLERADIKLRIPMSSKVESLNVAVSAAIVFYSWYKNLKD